MQNEHISTTENDRQSVSPQIQQLLKHLEEVWTHPYKPPSEVLKRITRFLVQLPEVYQTLGMTKVAEYFVNNLSLHFLDIIATFQQKAAEEGISSEERIQTLRGVMELFPEMMGISKHIAIRSIEELVTLSNITFSLLTLSQVDSAEEAQSWMYELPTLYCRQLIQERLVTNVQVQFTVTKKATKVNFSGYVSWDSSLPPPTNVSAITESRPTIA